MARVPSALAQTAHKGTAVGLTVAADAPSSAAGALPFSPGLMARLGCWGPPAAHWLHSPLARSLRAWASSLSDVFRLPRS